MEKEQWSSRLGFILASVGSAVGIGNVWRFPYIMAENGGGTFLLVYIICLFLFGLPLMLLEIATGRLLGGSLTTAFQKIGDRVKWLSYAPIITVFFILGYYMVITGWVLAYFVNSLSGMYQNFNVFSSSVMPILFTSVSIIITFFVVLLGVKKGIERVSKIMVPILFILLLVLLVRSLIFPNALTYVKSYFTPSIDNFFNLRTWLLAAAQVMFSLSVGMGVLVTYGGYLKKEENILNSSIVITVADTFVAIISAILVFSFVQSFGLSASGGIQLSFIVFPQIFQNIELGNIFGCFFFFLLFIAAITSAISMVELIVKNVDDNLHLGRKKSVLLIFAPFLVFGCLVSLSYTEFLNVNLLEILDNVFGNFMLPICAVIICVAVSWHWKINELVKEMGIIESLPLDKIGKYGEKLEYLIAFKLVLNLVKFVIPLILTVIILLKIFGIF